MSESLVEVRKNTKVKQSGQQKNANPEISELLESYQEILALAEVISNSILIKNNNWILQVKSIRQHYLYNDENGLSEIRSFAKCAIEIGKRSEGRNAGVTALYSVGYNTEEQAFELNNEQLETKATLIKASEKNYISKIMAFINK